MLHALVLGASALEVEFQTSGEAPIFLLEGAQPASMLESFGVPMPDVGDLISMVNKMNQMPSQRMPVRPTNPCDEVRRAAPLVVPASDAPLAPTSPPPLPSPVCPHEQPPPPLEPGKPRPSTGGLVAHPPLRSAPRPQDQMVTGCRDASCLKSHLEVLSPSCAMFLLKSQVATPSPSPMPAMMPRGAGSSYFSVSFMGEDGKMHTESGSMNSAEGKRIGSEMSSMLDLMMPGLASVFEEPRPRMPEPRQAPPPQPRAARSGGHPCNDEVLACADELGPSNTGSEAIQQCLVRHYAQLSAECKCMLHQLMGDDERLPVAKSAAPPGVRTVTVVDEELIEMPPPRHHRSTCVIFMWMLFVTLFIVVRGFLRACCAAKPVHVAFVPPETAGATVSVEPLIITKEIK